MKSDDSSHAEAPHECKQNISNLPETLDLAQSGADVSEINSSALQSKADTLTFMSIQLGWLQEQPPTLTLVYFYIKRPFYMVGMHSVFSSFKAHNSQGTN